MNRIWKAAFGGFLVVSLLSAISAGFLSIKKQRAFDLWILDRYLPVFRGRLLLVAVVFFHICFCYLEGQAFTLKAPAPWVPSVKVFRTRLFYHHLPQGYSYRMHNPCITLSSNSLSLGGGNNGKRERWNEYNFSGD